MHTSMCHGRVAEGKGLGKGACAPGGRGLTGRLMMGRANHRRSRRLPMGVTQRQSMPNTLKPSLALPMPIAEGCRSSWTRTQMSVIQTPKQHNISVQDMAAHSLHVTQEL